MSPKLPRDVFFNEYQHVLMSLEQAVLDYRNTEASDLNDHQVDKAYEGLERTYKKQSEGRNPPNLRLKPVEKELFEVLTEIAEFYLGNRFSDEFVENIRDENEEDLSEDAIEDLKASITVSHTVITECFKRLRKSIKLWSDTYGKYGYLDYISNFLAD